MSDKFQRETGLLWYEGVLGLWQDVSSLASVYSVAKYFRFRGKKNAKSIQRDSACFDKLKSLTCMERHIKYRSKLNLCQKQDNVNIKKRQITHFICHINVFLITEENHHKRVWLHMDTSMFRNCKKKKNEINKRFNMYSQEGSWCVSAGQTCSPRSNTRNLSRL